MRPVLRVRPRREPPDLEQDAMRETGNIGAAYAATALTRITGQLISIGMTDVHIVPVEELPQRFGGMSDIVSAVYMNQIGFAPGGCGNILLAVFPVEKSLWLANDLMRRGHESDPFFCKSGNAAIIEVGAICACAYLNALSRLIDRTLMPSPPMLAIDMLGAILQLPTMLLGEHAEQALALETHMTLAGGGHVGTMLFIPEPGTRTLVVSSFGTGKA